MNDDIIKICYCYYLPYSHTKMFEYLEMSMFLSSDFNIMVNNRLDVINDTDGKEKIRRLLCYIQNKKFLIRKLLNE